MIGLYSLRTGKKVAEATEQEYLSCPDRFIRAQQMMGRRCVWVHEGNNPLPAEDGAERSGAVGERSTGYRLRLRDAG